MRFVFKLFLVVIFLTLFLKIGDADSSAMVNVNFVVTDSSGNPLPDALVIVQGITNSGFSQNKLTDSSGRVSFALNKNEIFIYITYKLSYSQQIGSAFLTSGDRNFQITLQKIPDNQWYFYLINNGELELQFKSLDSSTNYNPGDSIREAVKITNMVEKNIQIIADESTFRVLDGDTANLLRDWGNFNLGNQNDLTSLTLKKGGWMEITLSDGTVKFCGGNLIMNFKGQIIELSGAESICEQGTQNRNEIPEWILNGSYRLKVAFSYQINSQNKQIGLTSQKFFINNVEWKPEIISSPQTNAVVGGTWSYNIGLKSYDEGYSDVLSKINYKLIQSPDGMNVDKNLGSMSWVPQKNGNYQVIVRVYYEYFENDPQKIAFTDQTFTLVVTGGIDNNLPVITSNPVLQVNEHQVYSYQVTATDADGDPLTYSLTTAPAFLSISTNTGLVSGTAPVVNADTPFSVTVSVSDGKESTTRSYTLTVKDVPFVNSPPVITSTPITQVNENQDYSYQFTATDVDNDPLVYSLTQKPQWLSINSVTGLVSGTAPSVNFDTDFSVNVLVSDGTGRINQDYTLVVKDILVVNNLPVITSTPLLQINENQNYSYQVVATDADGNTLTYSLTTAPAWLTINPVTGLVSGSVPLVSYDTNYAMAIKVSDGEGSTTQVYTLSVLDVPFVNNSPVITSTAVTGVNETKTYSYQVTATDAEGDALFYSLPLAPSWLSINQNTGIITGMAPIVFGDTRFTIDVLVSDGIGGDAKQEYSVIVKNSNNRPDAEDEKITTNTNTQFNLLFPAKDVDGDVLNYVIVDGPKNGNIQLNSSNGAGTYTPNNGFSGYDSFTFKVNDGLEDSRIATISMLVNNQPIVMSVPVTQISEHQTYTYQFTAMDADGDFLVYALVQAPNWLNINANTGLISGIAPQTFGSTIFKIRVVASDGKSGVGIQDYTIFLGEISRGNSHGVRNIPIDSFDEQQSLNKNNFQEISLENSQVGASTKEAISLKSLNNSINQTPQILEVFILAFLVLSIGLSSLLIVSKKLNSLHLISNNIK